MIPLHSQVFGRFQENKGAIDVGHDKAAGVGQRAVDMGFGSKVDNRIDVLAANHFPNLFGIADIALDENIARIIGYVLEVIQVARISELVVYHDAILGIALEHVTDKVGANKSGATRNHQFLHLFPSHEVGARSCFLTRCQSLCAAFLGCAYLFHRLRILRRTELRQVRF